MEMTVYQAARGFTHELVRELGDVTEVRDPLVIAPGPPKETAWAQNVWYEPQWITVDSINDAARRLKAVQRNWALCSSGCHRRAALIQEALPKVSARPHVFGSPLPDAPLGSWTLWDKNLVLASPRCSSPFPNGEYNFDEDKKTPPNRAYLKLWEVFTRISETPRPGQLCIDLGGSPGGWSWVIQGFGANVFAIDKAPLDPAIERLPLVQPCQGSAFGLDPRHVGHVDWLFSDVICYPDRLRTMLERWLELGDCKRFVITVKLQGDTDFEALQWFREYPGSRLIHLFQNKHELTWIKL